MIGLTRSLFLFVQLSYSSTCIKYMFTLVCMHKMCVVVHHYLTLYKEYDYCKCAWVQNFECNLKVFLACLPFIIASVLWRQHLLNFACTWNIYVVDMREIFLFCVMLTQSNHMLKLFNVMCGTLQEKKW